MNNILKKLYSLQDKKYAEFQAKLIPNIDKKSIIGVRTPELKQFAKELVALLHDDKKGTNISNSDVKKFLKDLPHKYFDENQLHIFILSFIKNYEESIKLVNEFLPYVDNWATCDQLSPKVFGKHKKELLKNIKIWIKSGKAFKIRFAVGMLMQHFLDEDFDKEYLNMVLNIKFRDKSSIKEISVEKDFEKYYVEMMRAWYFATALSKQYDDTITIFKNKKLNAWTHNKSIQKAIESYRVSDSHKKFLRSLKV